MQIRCNGCCCLAVVGTAAVLAIGPAVVLHSIRHTVDQADNNAKGVTTQTTKAPTHQLRHGHCHTIKTHSGRTAHVTLPQGACIR